MAALVDTIAYVRICFEDPDTIYNPDTLVCCFGSSSGLTLAAKLSALDIVHVHENHTVTVKGTNLVDMMALIYTDAGNHNIRYLFGNPKVMKVWSVRDDAVIPSKVRASDVGYDLTIVAKHKNLSASGNCIMYDTGIKVQVPWGHYAEIVPRSSLSKTGWMLANSVGIIDPSYNGNIYIAVTRVNATAEELPLPFRGFQLIIRKQHHVRIEVETTTELAAFDTARGDGGFGSTNNV
jgi:deoxyuridine 5'-triphosphate nucleotidohydrolase